MKCLLLLQLLALVELLAAVPIADIGPLAKRDGVVTVTATINGKAATWTQAAQAWSANAGATTPAAATRVSSTVFRTHYVTRTVKKGQNKSKRGEPETTNAPERLETGHKHDKRGVIVATIMGQVVSWTDGAGGAASPTSAAAAGTTSIGNANIAQKNLQKDVAATRSKVAATPSKAAASLSKPSSSPSSSSSSSSSDSISGDLKDFSPPGEFQDGKIKCSDFPSGQGVVRVPWIGLGGWTSIQQATMGGSQSKSCTEGLLCSYACQAGMSKTQWPSSQPSNGESRGGLLCKGGYLHRTNTAKKTLCEWGANTAHAVSKLDKVVSLCRTDYPGSENMNIPTRLIAGGKEPVSVVNEDNYYQWQGKKTSTQYYVNNAGVDVEGGCVWGTDGSDKGNWAPVVLGAGTTGGTTWLSIMPNPNNTKKPNYNLKIEADGGKVSGECKYENGLFSGGSNGCTVAVTDGAAKFVFY